MLRYRLMVFIAEPGRHETVGGWYDTVAEAISVAGPLLEASSDNWLFGRTAMVYDLQRARERTALQSVVWRGFPERVWRSQRRTVRRLVRGVSSNEPAEVL